MYSLSFLRNWSMQSYSATITCSIVASFALNGLSTPKWYKFTTKYIENAILWNLKAIFIRIYFSLVVALFFKLWLSVCILLNVYRLSFNTPVASPICILRAKLWKIFVKCQIVVFNKRYFFLKIYIFEVVTFYLTLQWSKKFKFCSGGSNL